MLLRYIVFVVCLLLGIALYWARSAGPLRDPHEALADFYEARDRAEDQLIDPLIVAGTDVVPLVLEAVADKEMHLRRYAISYLGMARQREAIPALEGIVLDDSEIYYFRADALESLCRIDPSRASALASQFVGRSDLLGDVARSIAAGQYDRYERTWWEAFRSIHY